MTSNAKHGMICALLWLVGLALPLLYSAEAQAVVYYVNDGNTTNDVWTSVVGSDANSGLATNLPKRTITNLVATYNLTAGDVLYVDTGVYSNYTVVITNAGTALNPIVIQGSTNWVGGGSVLNRGSSSFDVLLLATARHVVVRDLRVQGGSAGIRLTESQSNRFERIIAGGNVYGFRVQSFAWNTFHQCAAITNFIGFDTGSGAGYHWDSGVAWSNTTGFRVNGSISISNSIIVGGTAFSTALPAVLDSIVIWQSALFAGYFSISELEKLSSSYRRLTWADPLLASPAGLDFHPLSSAGRYDPATGLRVTDAVDSVVIDLGDPARVFTNEPSPRGSAINVGMYGDSGEASISRTNTPWLFALTFNDGGSFDSTGTLWWSHGAFSNGATVRVQYSTNAGQSWVSVATGIPVTNRSLVWSATGLVSSLAGRWRVQDEGNPGIEDASDRSFSIRASSSATFTAYVNDVSTSGDIFSTMPGASTNLGIYPQQPRLTLQSLLDDYDFGPGDLIYIDSGEHTNTATIGSGDGGNLVAQLLVRGSTNNAAQRSVIRTSGFGLVINSASHINIADLVFRGNSYGMDVVNSASNTFARLMFVSNSVAGMRGGSMTDTYMSGLLFAGNLTGINLGSPRNQMDFSVFWNNSNAVSISANTILSISNSIIGNGPVAFVGSVAPLNTDYLLFWKVSVGGGYNNLYDYQKGINRSWHSSFGDPQFASPADLNFHLQSTAGRFEPLVSAWVTDAVYSAAIDFADPALGAGTESAPNGGRMNAGLLGGTSLASRSATNPVLQALSLQDGGQLTIGDSIYWNAVNVPSGGTVRLELSGDGGASWGTVASNVLASLGVYAWANTNYPSSMFARWRVVYEADESISSANSSNFVFRNGAFPYYINDASLVGDIYATAVGHDGNLGTTPATPKASFTNLISMVDLEPGDIVYIDTGVYRSPSTPVLGAADSGVATNPVIFQFSTNRNVGGAVISRSILGSDGFQLSGAGSVEFRNAIFSTNLLIALRIDNSTGIVLRSVLMPRANDTALRVSGSPSTVVQRTVFSQNTSNGITVVGNSSVAISHSVFWRNGNAGLLVQGGVASMTGSVVVASRSQAQAYQVPSVTNVRANYNCIFVESNATVAAVGTLTELVDSLGAWQFWTAQDRQSLAVDPQFANPAALDFHLRTETPQGRYDDTLGQWFNDSATSLLIDGGDPASSFAEEPALNGGRVNIGLYGGTTEASRGRTAPWLHAASLAMGGWARGTTVLHWVAGQLTNGSRVKVEYSPDGGESWSSLNSNVLANDEAYSWDTSTTNLTWAGLWRVTSLSDSNLTSQVTNVFALRDGSPMTAYVNDNSLLNDLYTTGVGAGSNRMATIARPLASLAEAVANLDLEAGDAIYVDTGTYTETLGISFSRADSGTSNGAINVKGPTNALTARINRTSSASGINGVEFRDARWISLSNLVFGSAHTGVKVEESRGLNLSVRAVGNAANGFTIMNSTNVSTLRSAAVFNGGYGIASFTNTSLVIDQAVVWSNVSGAIYSRAGALTVSNSVLHAYGSGRYVYQINSTSDLFRADYNNILVRDGAEAALWGNRALKFMANLRDAAAVDLRSLNHDPLFADAGGGDFHLQSAAGRFSPGGIWVTDVVTSVMVDAGDPARSVAAEPVPNGARLNIGRHGNSDEASRSPTNARLLALSYNDGGVARGTNALYWMAGGDATGHTLTIQFSADNGSTWTNVATNISASVGGVPLWDTTLHGSTLFGLWRLISEQDPAVTDANDRIFTVNNGSLSYFVNDSSTDQDIYTLAPGSSINDGLLASTPAASVQEILERYSLSPGDRIYVDTGTYDVNNNPILLNNAQLGVATNPIVIQGSTNVAAGGTVLDAGFSTYAIRIQSGAAGLTFRDLRIERASIGFDITDARDLRLEGVSVRRPRVGPFETYGVNINLSSNIVLKHCAVSGFTNALGLGAGLRISSSSRILWSDSVLWSNTIGIRVDAGEVAVTNSVFGLFGPSSYAYALNPVSQVYADFNNYFRTNGARLARHSTYSVGAGNPLITLLTQYEALSQWTRDRGVDRFSLSHDPLFANAAEGDYRLLSQGGRELPGVGVVQDAESSVLIDAGPTNAGYEEEPAPNGGRINLGIYANHGDASRSPTNGRLTAVSLNDGGIASGTNQLLYWIASGDATSHLVGVDISYDNGSAWWPLATNVPANVSTVRWDTTVWDTHPYYRWRVRSMNDSNVTDMVDTWFTIRNSNIAYYVNDGFTNGDVYCAGTGYDYNNGLSAAQPMPSLADILRTYDLEGGDVVYLDTGLYATQAVTTLEFPDSGSGTNVVILAGSTNVGSTGTVLEGAGLRLEGAASVALRNITLSAPTNREVGLNLINSSNVLTDAFTIRGGYGIGVRMASSRGVQLDHMVIAGSRTNGLLDEGSYATLMQSSVLWSNKVSVRAAGSSAPGHLAISNSIIACMGTAQVAYVVSGGFTSDYNTIFLTNGAVIANVFTPQRPLDPLQMVSVAQWARETGRDQRSSAFHPLFAEDGSDFHLRSQAGRFSDVMTGLVYDAETSPGIDAGPPTFPFGSEPSPHGSRINMGRYGNTGQASLSPTNAVLMAVSLSDGGIASGSQLLYWIARGDATGMNVRLQYSSDGGQVWTNIATNLSAGSSSFQWVTTNFTSTVLGRWRVVSESDPAVADVNNVSFAVRNGPVRFYVNDSVTTGDVYCTAAGVHTNNGLSAAAPLDTLASVLTHYDLEAGDIVYVDTGWYTNSTTILMGQLDAGTTSNQLMVTVQGSTNVQAGGTVIEASGQQAVFEFLDTEAVALRHLRLIGASGSVVRLTKARGMLFERVQTEGGTYGYEVSQSVNGRWQNSSMRNHAAAGITAANFSTNLSLLHVVVWSNGLAGVELLVGSSLAISNSALGAFGTNAVVYNIDAGSHLSAEFNAILVTNGALVAEQAVAISASIPRQWQSVSRWARDTGSDRYTLAADPLFADPAQGDFHLRSQAGRYVPATGTFTNDAETSPLVDAGSFGSSFGSEPLPSGNRANIGMYGNTEQASRTPTNAALFAVSLRDGGRAEGTQWPLYWVGRGSVTSHTVRLEYRSGSVGAWTIIATGLPARVTSPIYWNTTVETSTVFGVWRVVSELQTNLVSESSQYFAIRNQVLSFYVNDASTVGDVYTTAAGSSANDGTNPGTPKDRVSDILDQYDLEPGDTVYLDTGSYFLNGERIEWGRFDAWDDTHDLTPLAAGGVSVLLLGSTNYTAQGSQYLVVQSPGFLRADRAYGLAIKNISVRQGVSAQGVSLEVENARYVQAERVNFQSGFGGIYLEQAQNFSISNSTLRDFSFAGLYTSGADDTHVLNCDIWSNRIGVFQSDEFSGDMLVENSSLGVFGAGSFGFIKVRGLLNSDYNSMYRVGGGFAGGTVVGNALGGGTTRYETVTSWYTATSNDTHTLAVNPLLAGLTDFHLQSPLGRYVTGTGYITNGADAISPLLDAGRPSSVYSRETMPNGGRIDIGQYGNTAESSLSPTNSRLTVIALNDGGSAAGNINLRWNAHGAVGSHLLTLQYSSNGGGTWTNIAVNVLASQGSYLWDSVPYGRSAAGLWRIFSQVEPSAVDICDQYFALRNGGSIPYYVNDGTLVGDVYCTAAGNDANDGYIPSTPKASIQSLIDAVDLEPGDVVYIDTGTYLISSALTIGDLDAGLMDKPVVFQGSTNRAAGGSTINRLTGVGSGIELYQTIGIALKDLRVINGGIGVNVSESDQCYFENIRSENHQQSAFNFVQSGPSNIFVGCVAGFSSNGLLIASSSLEWRNGVIWGNQWPIQLGVGGNLRLWNSVAQAVGPARRIYYAASFASGTVTSDYNNFVLSEGSLVYERIDLAFGQNEISAKLSDWQSSSGQDKHSFVLDPQFVNANAGDFHIRSASGRFLDNGSLTNDAPGLYSPLLDTGDPLSIWTNEPAPNGARINIGSHGNTAQASLSQTNPWLLALTYNDGGRIGGTVEVFWAAGGMTNGALVRLEQAGDGVDFSPFASNLLASSGSASWNVSSLPASDVARWRVVCQECGVSDQNDAPITIRNQSLVLYVNDSSQVGDVYTLAPGSYTNTGITPLQPLPDLGLVAQQFVLGPGDVIYVDTGDYQLTNTEGIVIGLIGNTLEKGEEGAPIRIVGSTNEAAGGSRILGLGQLDTNSPVLRLAQTRYIDIRDIALEQGGVGLWADSAPFSRFEHIRTHANRKNGFSIENSYPLEMDRCLAWSNGLYGLEVADLSSITFDRGVVWSNYAGGIRVRVLSQLALSNSVVHAHTPGRYAVLVEQLSQVRGDYNIYWTPGLAELGRVGDYALNFTSLAAWQKYWQADADSAVLDPDFADAYAGNFYLKSKAGRFNPDPGSFVSDAETSWAIDFGDPLRSVGQESTPNGDRMNVGPQGALFSASRSITNPADYELRILSFDDGGQMASGVNLRWLARGHGTADLVHIDFSVNNGVEWRPLATNVPASQGSLFWNPHPSNSTPVARWRVVSQSGGAVAATNETAFALRLRPVVFYVNDQSSTGDVYTTGLGSSSNDGLTASAPLDQVQAVLDRYDLEGGDQILMDTGYYTASQQVTSVGISNNIITNYISVGVTVLGDDNGGVTNPVYITGSTNRPWGGSILDRQSTNLGSGVIIDANISLIGGRHINISHLDLTGGNIGLYSDQSQSITVSNVIIRDGGRSGFVSAQNSTDWLLDRLIVSRMSGNGLVASLGDRIKLQSCILWSNQQGGVSASGGSIVTISNSVIHAFGDASYCYDVIASTIRGNYNNLFTDAGARPARIDGLDIEGLLQWNVETIQDLHSLSMDPQFADPGNLDFHPRSPYGRFDQNLGMYVVTNESLSPLVDAGSPADSYADEPEPNGGRRNIGLFGNTTEASKGLTNAWLMARSGSSGGRAAGAFFLAWSYGNLAPTGMVSIDFSYDSGTNWIRIASNRVVSSGLYLWDTSFESLAVTPIARWRVVSEVDTNIIDATDRPFALNGPFSFYVNDTNITGDVFTTAVGTTNNLGIFPHIPMSDIRLVLDVWDLEGGDTVYVDTGYYEIGSNTIIELSDSDAGRAGDMVSIVGSSSSNGVSLTWIEAVPAEHLIKLAGSNLRLGNFRLVGAGMESSGTNIFLYGISLTNNAYVTLGGYNTSVSNVLLAGGRMQTLGELQDLDRITVQSGLITLRGRDVTMRNSLVYGTQSVAATVGGTNINLINNTMMGNPTAVRVDGVNAVINLRNNILVADGQNAEGYVIKLDNGVLSSDYNNLLARNGAWIGISDGKWEKLLYWQRASGQDANSISVEPLFANELAGDFHLKSVGGRSSALGVVTDLVHSLAIDLGAPGSSFANESAPNGGRINLGAYGNTVEASRSKVSPWLFAITVNDGGVMQGTNTLRWSGGSLPGASTLTIRYSPDGGVTWTNIATGVDASLGQYVWDSTVITQSSYRAVWGVVLESDTNIFDNSDGSFALRNSRMHFFVNDSVTNGDVYTTAAGHATNTGTEANSPKDTLTTLLREYDVEGGDAIYVDTGIYNSTSGTQVIWSRGGDTNNGALWIWGSTNFEQGGTVLNAATGLGVRLLDIPASYVHLRNLTLRNADIGVVIDSNRNSLVERVQAISNRIGVYAFNVSQPIIRNSRFVHNSEGGVEVQNSRSNQIYNNTFYGNQQWAMQVSSSSVANLLVNNIFVMSSTGSVAYAGVLNDAFVDYNVYQLLTANAGIQGNQRDLLGWQLATKRDYRSAITNPLFASVGSGDFHLQSEQGRWVDGQGFTNDAVTSWAVDKGSTNLNYDLEPAPNGARVNIGAYGNTEYASMGRLSTQALVEVRSLNATTFIRETNSVWPLVWTSINVPTSELFNVQFSGDGGSSWYTLSNNVPAYQEYILWNASPFFNTRRGYWRVVGISNTNYVDVNDAQFELFFGTFRVSQVFADLGTNGIVFRGAWAENYQVQWGYNILGTNYVGTNAVWFDALTGPGPEEKASFLSTNGGDFIYRDLESVTNRHRLYRVLLKQY